MKITFTRRTGYVGSLMGFSIQINDKEVQCLYPGESFVYEGQPTKDIRITSSLSRSAVIPFDCLGEENNVFLQYITGLWVTRVQAIVSSGEKIVGVFEKTRLL